MKTSIMANSWRQQVDERVPGAVLGHEKVLEVDSGDGCCTAL